MKQLLLKKCVLLSLLFSCAFVAAQGTCWKALSPGSLFTIGVKTDGTLWCWGGNEIGQLGDGTLINRELPVQIGSDTNWKTVSSGKVHSLALKEDGTLWVTGANNYGQLGLDNNTNVQTWTQLGSATNWQSIFAGGFTSFAINTAGEIYCWGANTFGELGDGTFIDKDSPVLFGTTAQWAMISPSENQTLGIKANGSLWQWGIRMFDTNGQMEYLSTPFQIGTDFDWQYVSSGRMFSLARKNNGTIWGWGNNYSGQLALSSMFVVLPEQIGTESNWMEVHAARMGDFMIGIKGNGTMWSWGSNASAQLGLAHANESPGINQAGSDNDWIKVLPGRNHVYAFKGDGNMRAWGSNAYGQLGTGVPSTGAHVTFTCPTLSLTNELSEAKVAAYPNPVNDIMTIEIARGDLHYIELYDAQGRVVKNVNAGGLKYTLDMSYLSAGMYILKVASSDGTNSIKVVKQ